MKKINLILGNHNHQPVGNFDFVIENTYKNAYSPFLNTLKKYKNIKFNFHYTGCLLEQIEAKFPEHIKDLKKLVSEGVVELQSGGFYEPILSSISYRDKIIQIERLNKYIKKTFGKTPNGAWLAERVWEPTLVKPLVKSGINYIALDDSQFLPTGVDINNIFGYYTTDDEDYMLNIFPISQNLRYLIPFREAKKTIEYLDSIATEEGDRVVVLHDDGEKYGDWPDTYKWVYEDGWLNSFFDALNENKEWIKTTTYSEYMNSYKPLGRVYIPTGSYEEMLTWVLPSKVQSDFHSKQSEVKKNNENDIILKFARGGFWRNYFRKYSESNRMNKKMLFVSKLVHSMKEGKNKENALTYLLKGECNCPYWHGTFGGLYLNNLRHATYQNLINAEIASEKEIFGNDYFEHKKIDFDLDGYEEIITTSEKENFIFHTLGGTIIEWDKKEGTAINFVDTLKRREEAYHIDAIKNKNKTDGKGSHVSIHEMVKTIDSESEKYLVFDENEKVIGVEHILEGFVSSEDFALLKYNDLVNLKNTHYKLLSVKENKDKKTKTIIFETECLIKDVKIKITKNYTVKKNGGVELKTVLENTSDTNLSFVYAVENNITLLAGGEKDRYYLAGSDFKNIKKISNTLSDFGECEEKIFVVRDEAYIKTNIIFESCDNIKYLYMPNFTISDAVNKLEMNYQNSTIVTLKKIELKPKNKLMYKLKINYKDN